MICLLCGFSIALLWVKCKRQKSLPLKGEALFLLGGKKAVFTAQLTRVPIKIKWSPQTTKRAGINLLAFFYVPLAAEAFFLLAPKKNQKRADIYLLFLLLSPPGLPPLGRLGASSPSSSGVRPSISISASLLERLILP